MQSRVNFCISAFLFSAFLTACAPQEQFYQPSTAVPVLAADKLVAADGAELPLKSWLPKDKPKAVIIAVHGFNDYSNAFEGTGKYFSKRGIAVYAYDQRGFGRAPETGIWAGEENLTSDLAAGVKQLLRRYPRTPLYILGESMGGAVAIVSLADPKFPHVDGVILSAPAVWGAETMNPLYHSTLWLAAHTMPFYRLTGEDLRILASDNIPMLRALYKDPLVIKKTRIDAIYGVVWLMDSAYEKVPEVKTPVLLLYGAHDQVIPKHPIEAAHERFTAPVKFITYDEGYHMLLRDLQRERVMKDILGWIKK